MDAAQALADLTEVSSQIEAAVLADASGAVLASTFEEPKGERVAETAAALLEAARETGSRESTELRQVLAATASGAVFLVRDGRHLVAAVTGPEPTVGLVFYDLKTCLRLVDEDERRTRADESSPVREKPNG